MDSSLYTIHSITLITKDTSFQNHVYLIEIVSKITNYFKLVLKPWLLKLPKKE